LFDEEKLTNNNNSSKENKNKIIQLYHKW
jgi:hypothetical protein